MIRLLADGFVDRWTRAKRQEYSAKQNELTQAGILPIPRGIGLSDIYAKANEN
jgi:hypothetical protein